MDTSNLTIKKIKDLLDKKEISTVELLNEYLARINSKNQELNCLIEVFDADDSANYWDRQRAKGDKDIPQAAMAIKKAQKDTAKKPEFKGTVKLVETIDFVRKAEDSPHPGHEHHEFGNAETYFLIGDALGKAMLTLLPR